MASFTSAAATAPSFAGFKATTRTYAGGSRVTARPMVVRASLRDAAGLAVVATAASAMVAVSSAMAFDVLLGSDTGELAFVPNNFSVSSGETIVFKNNAAFPHNVVFDEDEIPSGVDAGGISMKEEDLLNAPGETYSVALKEKGTYSFYCSPHQGAGMVGKVIVK